MAIPKEPRQLMINIMYLVLTALLALNVSAEIFNAFKVVDKGLKESNSALKEANEKLPPVINKRAKATAEMEKYAERTGPAEQYAKEFADYIDEIVDYMIDQSGNKDGEVTQEGDYRNIKGVWELKGKKDKDITTRYLVGKDGQEGKGDEIKQKIEETRQKFLSLIDEADRPAFESKLSLEVDDETWKQSSKAKSWAEFNFKQMPLAATLPILHKFKNDALSSEAAVLNYLLGKVGGETVVLDQFTVVSAPKKSYIIKGEPFETEIFLSAAAGQSSKTDIKLSVNGANLNVNEEGIANWKTVPGSVGVKKYTAKATVTNPVTGETDEYTNSFEFEVGERSVNVAAEKMNVFYIGVDNPVSISAAGVSSNDLNVTGSGGGITLSPDGDGTYTVKVTQQGTAKITVSGGGLQPTDFEFRVKRIPDPVAQVGKTSGGTLGNGEFKAQQGVLAVLKNFDFDARCNIVGFKLVRAPKRQDVQIAVNSGAQYGGDARGLVNQAKPGDRFFFEEVKARCPGDKAARQINDMVFNIR
jgi:gliding motility-associated protein GldM